MHTNSLFAYHQLVQPELTQREQDVLEVIEKLGESTCMEVAKAMGRYPNQISGRFTALKSKGVIIQCGRKRIGETNHDIYKINN